MNRWFKPSIVVTSAPLGGVIIEPLMVIKLIFTILPRTKPAITAKLFFNTEFIIIFDKFNKID